MKLTVADILALAAIVMLGWVAVRAESLLQVALILAYAAVYLSVRRP